MGQQLHRNIFLVSLIFAVGSLPLSRAILSIATVLLLLNWLIEGDFQTKWKKVKASPIIWFFPGFYLLHLFSALYTENTSVLQQDLWVKLPLFLAPVLILTSPQLKQKEIIKIAKALITGCFIATIFCLVVAFQENIDQGYTLSRLWDCLISAGCEDGKAALNYRYFTYENFSSALFLHPTYFALFLNLSSIFIVWIWLKERKTFLFRSHVGWALLLLYFFGIILMLSSRMQIINFLLLGFTGLILLGWMKRRLLLSISLIALFGLFASVIILTNPQNKARFLDLFQNEPLPIEEVQNSGSEVRKFIWDTSWDLITQSFWLGYGTGDVNATLNQEYEELGFTYATTRTMNAHNQFLETWLGLGVVGFLYLVCLFFIPASRAIKAKNYVYLAFLGLFFLSCLTESFFNRQFGVNFYVFFNAILIYPLSEKRIPSDRTDQRG